MSEKSAKKEIVINAFPAYYKSKYRTDWTWKTLKETAERYVAENSSICEPVDCIGYFLNYNRLI